MADNKILNKPQQTLVDLTNGTRKPKTQYEKKLQKQINEIKAKGGIVDIPAEFF